MRLYVYRGTYTAEAWSKLIENPMEITEALRPSAEKFGGKIILCALTFGIAVGAEPGGFMEFPDDASAMAWSIYLEAQGIVRESHIVPALTSQESLGLLQRLKRVSS